MKKLGALILVCLLFSGAGYDNTASVINLPVKKKDSIHIDTVKITEMENKVQELNKLMLELKKYESKK